MIKNIVFKAGSSPDQSPLSIELEPSVTIFVGPNNSGKSTALSEFYSALQGGSGNVIESVQILYDTEIDLDHFLATHTPSSSDNYYNIRTFSGQTENISADVLRRIYMNRKSDFGRYWHYFFGPRVRYITGDQRTSLLQPQDRGDLSAPSSEFGQLVMAADKGHRFRAVVAEELGLHVGFDLLSSGSHIHIYFGKSPPVDEGSVSSEFINWRKNALPISAVSDGVRAFSGILMKLTVGDPEVFVIDEPEAFLHPTLAHRLGRELANGAVDKRKFVFASTHSAYFLMGAIQSGAKVNIVRLTYRNDVGTARLLHNEALRTFMNDPMLRSVGVLDGLFYEHVIVTEADADRAFYSEINHRLLAADDARGIPNALFLNADNKQTVPTIVKALRQVGIPAASILDIDLIFDDWNIVSKQLEACNYPIQAREGLAKQTEAVVKSLKGAALGDDDRKKRNYIKSFAGKGVGALKDRSEKEAADILFDTFDQYGCFAVRSGELENWLPDLPNVPRKKEGNGSFRASIFKAMGSDPSHTDYLQPGKGDIWDFIGRIRSWLVNPNRKGIPN
jgi:AAA domain, putative AbiEii toxin, Type IV TA system